VNTKSGVSHELNITSKKTELIIIHAAAINEIKNTLNQMFTISESTSFLFCGEKESKG